MLAGQVQVVFSPIPSTIQYVKADTFRSSAVTTAIVRMALPDVPTVSDFVPGYEANVWKGIGAPRNTPAEIIDKLTERSMLPSPIPDKGALADLGSHSNRGHLRTSANLSPKTPRSGLR